MEILHDDIRQTGEIFDNIKQSLLNKGADVGECTAPAELPGIIDSLEFAAFDCQAVKDCIDGEFARTAYVDSTNAATYSSMKDYADAKGATILAAANAYTDEKVKGGGGSITVDDALSLDSKNPVQNRVVTRALRGKQDTLDGIFFINDGTTVKEVHLNETITLQGGGGGGAVTNAEIVLTNAMQAIGTGSDLIYDGATLEASTKVLFYVKGTPVTGFSLALSSNNPSIPSSWNPDASTITVSIANGTNLSSPVLITATATDAETGYSATATFEVFGVPGGKDGTSYNLVLDNYAITGYYQDPDNTKTLVYTPQSLNLRCVEKSASGVKDVSSQDFSVYYAYDTTAAPGAQKISLLSPFIPTPEGHHYISFVLYKDSVLWDAQTVPIIVDGRKGATGDAGTGLTFKTGFQAEATMATDGSAITAVYYPIGYTPVTNDLVVGEVESDGNPARFDKVQVFQYDGSAYKKYDLTGKDTGVCGVAPGSGHIILWDGSQWIDVGSVRGGYIHQKYANSDTGPESAYISYLDEDIAFTTQPGWEKGEFPGRFIGIVVNDQANFVGTVSDYTWCKWEGEDGYGMEQIFQLGGVTPPPAPVQGLIQDTIWYSYDYVPTSQGWSDFPLTPTSDQPRCWVSTRMLGTNHRREWSTPVVYSSFSEIPTVLTIQNDNINWLINYDGNTARIDIEQCKLNLVTDGVISDQGYFDFKWRIKNSGDSWRGSGEEDTNRGIKLTLKSSGDGSFEVLSRANKYVFDVNVIEVEFKHQASASAPITNHHGAISVTKITADHCYTIFADQEVLNEDPYDNSIAFINDGRGTTIRVLKEEIQGVDTYLTAFPDDLVLTGYLVNGEGDEEEVWQLSEEDGAPIPFTLNADNWQLPDGNDPDPNARIASLKIVATMSNSLGQSIVCDTEQIIIHKDGADGMDSPYDEFVYFVNDNDGDNMEQNPGLNQLDPTDPVFQQDDYLPTANDGSAYTDHPTGVSHGQTEWYAVRHKVQKIDPSTNRPYLEWEAFDGPFVWSSYGKDGRDGDGVEYVFYLSSSVSDKPGLKNDRGWFADHPSGSAITDYDKIHNNPDFLPAVDSSSNEHWEDDVQTVTKELPAQWVAKRRYKQIGTDPAKHWTDFGEPTLWSVYADSSLKADLSNQNMQIGIDADDKLNETFSNDTALSFSFGSTAMKISNVVISGD